METPKQREPDTYTCVIQEVFSGDDLVGMVDLGVENLHKRQRLRLSGVDTPNAVHADQSTEAGRVRTHVRDLVRNKRAQIRVVSRSGQSWVVELEVETPNGTLNLNQYLARQGYVYKKDST
jgi:hypothetical protein